MLTYQLKKSPGVPLYEALYRCIRSDILGGNLKPGQKLPSKRSLARNLEISKITVETAYGQLLEEGYIRACEKVGYFVETVDIPPKKQSYPQDEPAAVHKKFINLSENGTEHFPFSVWSRLLREVMLDYGERLLLPLPNQGIPELQQAIADHLGAFRGMEVQPRNIVIGAGADFLYNLVIQLLGREKIYAVEDPGYGKIRQIYNAGGVRGCISAAMDQEGVKPQAIRGADVLHISPTHHFPTGIVTPLSRRLELLEWAEKGEKWIIEDDYDSEFRFDAHPKPAMYTLNGERVIYMNSFSRSLSPSLRISYMILPEVLMQRFRQRLGFYSCTVPSFEQYTLARFLSRGFFEKHINRMRKFYRNRRNTLIAMLENCPLSDRFTILEEDAGLHFLLKVRTEVSDRALTARLEENGVKIRPLTDFYHEPKEDLHCFVVSYAGLREETLAQVLEILERIANSDN